MALPVNYQPLASNAGQQPSVRPSVMPPEQSRPRIGSVTTRGNRPIPRQPSRPSRPSRPTQAQSNPFGSMPGPPQFDQFQQFTDAALQNRMQTLNPQIESEQSRMAQDLAGRGIPIGSEQYNRAMQGMNDSFSRARNDANFGAMQFGLGAQNQAFNQQHGMNQLANALEIARMGNNTQMNISNNQLDLGRERLAQDLSMFDQNMGQRQNEFGLNFGEGQRRFNLDDAFRNNNMNFGQMMALENLGFRDANFARQGDQYQDQLALALLGMRPQSGGGQLDVQGAFNAGNANAMNLYGQQMNQYNNNMQGFGNLVGMGMSFIPGFGLSAKESKTNYRDIDSHKILKSVNDMDIKEWSYKGDDRRFIGPNSDDFNGKIGKSDDGGIYPTDMNGVALASIQALTERVEQLEAKDES